MSTQRPPYQEGAVCAPRRQGEIQYLLSPIAEGDLPPLYEEGGLFRYGGMRADEGIGPYNEIP